MLLRLTAALLVILAALFFAGGGGDAPSRSDLAELREERQRQVQLRLPDAPDVRPPSPMGSEGAPPPAPEPLPDAAPAPTAAPAPSVAEAPTPVDPAQPLPQQDRDAATVSTDPAPTDAAPAAEAPDSASVSSDAPPPQAETAPDPAPVLLYVTGSAVNLRAGPSTQNAVMGRVTRGQAVRLVQRLDNGWVEIEADGVPGTVFMSGDFLSETP